MEIKFDHDILQAAPSLEVILVEASIINPPTSNELWKEITDMEEQIHDNLPIEQIRHRPAIDATRKAYKACGKDPNRYRPSAEALCRRAAKNLELYRTLTAIDLINLLSMATGHSIGGFDADKIDGNTLTLGVGSANEPYEAIGRGPLNIEGLPVYHSNIRQRTHKTFARNTASPNDNKHVWSRPRLSCRQSGSHDRTSADTIRRRIAHKHTPYKSL